VTGVCLAAEQQVVEAMTLQTVLMVCLWLLQVADQLPWCYKDHASLLAAGKWMSAPELVHIIDSAWKHAELDLQQKGGTAQTSRKLHDAALGDTLAPASCQVAHKFRGALPASRLQAAVCEGNRLYIITLMPLLMRIKLPMHKNACKWGQAFIVSEICCTPT